MTRPRQALATIKAPEELDGEAILEWDRVCAELASIGRLFPHVRATLILYVEAWAIYRQVSDAVHKHGPVAKYSNGMIGPSPFYRIQHEKEASLVRLLDLMGLTPAKLDATPDAADDDEIDI